MLLFEPLAEKLKLRLDDNAFYGIQKIPPEAKLTETLLELISPTFKDINLISINCS